MGAAFYVKVQKKRLLASAAMRCSVRIAALASFGVVSGMGLPGRRAAIGRVGAAALAWRLVSGDSAASAQPITGGPPVRGDESLMSPKAHGTTAAAVQTKLRWDVDREVADRICSFNRHYAEYSGYYRNTNFLPEAKSGGEITYYDSVSGKPLFVAPRGAPRTRAHTVSSPPSHRPAARLPTDPPTRPSRVSPRRRPPRRA